MQNTRHILGHNVRQYRKHHRLTQLDLSLDSGVSETVIKEIERGAGNCRLDTIQLLAAFTGLTVADLFTSKEVLYAGT